MRSAVFVLLFSSAVFAQDPGQQAAQMAMQQAQIAQQQAMQAAQQAMQQAMQAAQQMQQAASQQAAFDANNSRVTLAPRFRPQPMRRPPAATKASLILVNPTKVNGTTLTAGKYVVEWKGSGPNVEVSVLRGKTILIKLQARLVDLKFPLAQGAVLTRKDADGTTVLTGVQFGGKRFAIELDESNNSVQSASVK